jgi:hypothetical protein
MHPRASTVGWPGRRVAPARAALLLDFVRERGTVHPRDADRHFAHGTVTNYWGGSSRATTRILDTLHYRGLLRIARRESGIRIYAPRDPGVPPPGVAARRARLDALVDAVVGIYAPLPGASLTALVGRLRYAVPQWRAELKLAILRARGRLAHARVDGVDWFWPAGERPERARRPGRTVRLLSPFDPVVWDRRRFALLWGWAYRFEAYTPVARRRFGHYALPLLWGDRVVGWATVAMRHGALHHHAGYVDAARPEPAFGLALDAELDRMRRFLGG